MRPAPRRAVAAAAVGPAVLELRDFALRENRAGGVLAPDVTLLQQGVMAPRIGEPQQPAAAPAANANP